MSWAAAPAQAGKTTRVFEGANEYTFKVPAGVTFLEVVAIGGSGGEADGVAGGAAAEVSGTIGATPGQNLYVEVGGRGEDESEGGEGGENGGGDATDGPAAGGGGGASDIREASRLTTPLSTEDTRLIVAAGGGGAGATGESIGGEGGNAGSDGSGGGGGYSGGGKGTETEGGLGAFGCSTAAGNGTLGEGGQGGYAGELTGPGGGGGGGLYGGGGGAGACIVGSSGGGGGSSLKPIDGLIETASLSQAPMVELTFQLLPPTISITTPADGGTYTQGQVVGAAYTCTPAEETNLESCDGTVADGEPINTSTVGSHSFKVEAEDEDEEQATETVHYTVEAKKTEEAGKGGSGGSVTPPPPPPPDTVLGSHPKKTIKTKKKKVSVRFSFSSPTAGATFECKLDKGAFAPCSSPKSYKVKVGKHTFSVRALNSAGADQTPATFSFKVKKKKKK